MRNPNEISNVEIGIYWLQDELARIGAPGGRARTDQLLDRMPRTAREYAAQARDTLEFVLPEDLKPFFIKESPVEREVDKPVD